MRKRGRGAVTLALVAVAVLLPQQGRAASLVPAPWLARQLTRPQTLVLRDATIRGELKLRELGALHAAFECQSCTFTDGIDARHVVFERELDLGGAVIRGPVDFHGARFEGVTLFGSGARPTVIRGEADFRIATFADLADFDTVRFHRPVDFTLARFRGPASFSEASFGGGADFAAAAFAGRVRFDHATFSRSADFTRALFEATADFRSSVFNTPSTFEEADFRGLADFGQTTFNYFTNFDDVRFGGDATFLGTTFRGKARDDDRAASFNHAFAARTLDFGGTTFEKFVLIESLVAHALSFDVVTFTKGALMTAAGVEATDVRFSPLDETSHLVDQAQQRRMLKLIETSAKARGDLGLANDAHYRLQELAARDDPWWRRDLDAVFYRGIAGYFVRPKRPLFVLIALAVGVAFTRQLRRRPPEEHAGRGLLEPLRGVANELFETFSRLVPRLGGHDEKTAPPSIGVRIEALVYRLLLVCVILGVANSNPTLRQMFDALL